MINDSVQAPDHSHSLWNYIDGAALIGGLSSPAWWHTAGEIIGYTGQGLIVFFAVLGGALRCAILIRDLRRGR